MNTGTSETPTADRSLERRYGERIVSRGIATFPTLILRWQATLGLADSEVVTLAHLLSYYRHGGTWPSVSIKWMAACRNVHRCVVERDLAQLVAKGYAAKAALDPRFRTFYFDLSGLLAQLNGLADAEQQGSRQIAEPGWSADLPAQVAGD